MWKDIPYVILSILIAVVLLSLHFPAKGEEPASGARATAEFESGYTSNGTDSAIGEPDFFFKHRETLEFLSGDVETALRGSVVVEETRFLTQDIENDQSLGLSLALGRQMTPELLLRGSLGLAAANTGDDWNLGGFYLATRTASLAADLRVEAVVSRAASELKFGILAGAHRYGKASFGNLTLLPFKIQPDDTRFGFDASLRQALGSISFLAAVSGEAVEVPLDDQESLGRLPGRKLRGSVGLEFRAGGIEMGGEGGGELVWAGGETLVRPYARLRLVAAIAPGLEMEALAGARVELVDALDFVGSFDRQAGLSLAYALNDTTRVFLSGERIVREGLLDPGAFSEETVVAAGVEQAASDTWSYRVRIAQTRHEDYAERYEKTEVSLGITGRI